LVEALLLLEVLHGILLAMYALYLYTSAWVRAEAAEQKEQCIAFCIELDPLTFTSPYAVMHPIVANGLCLAAVNKTLMPRALVRGLECMETMLFLDCRVEVLILVADSLVHTPCKMRWWLVQVSGNACKTLSIGADLP
jgi:hypothetical protein